MPNPTQDTTEPEIFYAVGGRALRQIDPNRLFKTGDCLINKHSQELWEMIAFHPKGVRVINWPHGNAVDWSWEMVYGFFQRVPEKDIKENSQAPLNLNPL